MNSTSNRFPKGLGNDSGELGHNLMDHTYRVGATGLVDGFDDQYYKGRRPNGIYIPRYVNLKDGPQSDKIRRGFGYQGGGSRAGWGQRCQYGRIWRRVLKIKIMNPGPWEFFITGFAESLPNHENKVYLNKEVLDKWGQPTLSIDAEWGPNELAINAQMRIDARGNAGASGSKRYCGL